MTKVECLVPPRMHLPKCEAALHHPGYKKEDHPDGICGRKARYRINDRNFCEQHAGAVALRILMEERSG